MLQRVLDLKLTLKRSPQMVKLVSGCILLNATFLGTLKQISFHALGKNQVKPKRERHSEVQS